MHTEHICIRETRFELGHRKSSERVYLYESGRDSHANHINKIAFFLENKFHFPNHCQHSYN